MSTHIFDFHLQLLLGALLCALEMDGLAGSTTNSDRERYLESQMLQEVCSAISLVGFGAAAGIDPDTDSRCLGPWRVLGSDLYSPLALAMGCFGRWTNSETVAQGGALGFRPVAHGSRETSLQRSDGIDGSAAP